jgi:LEA14-like dessication related protein
MRFKVRVSESGIFDKPSSTSHIFYWKPSPNSPPERKKTHELPRFFTVTASTLMAYKYGNLLCTPLSYEHAHLPTVNKMTLSIRKSLLLLLAFSLSGCAELTKYTDTIKPTASLTGMRLANINFEQVDLIFDLAVENKNPVALDLAGMDYDLKIANQSLVSGVTAKAIKIKADSTSEVQLPITLKFADLKKLPGELWDKDTFSYQLDTRFNLTLPVIGNYMVPVSKQGELPVPKVPEIKVKTVKVKNLSFTTADLVTQVEISNPNAFNLAINNFDYQLYINQQSWGKGKLNEKYIVPEKGKAVIEVPVKLDILNVGQSAYKLLLNKSPIEYQLTGKVTMDTGLELLQDYTMPLDIKGTAALQ